MRDEYLQEVMQSRVKVDIYAKARRKTFESYYEGDMGSDTHSEDIVIKLAELPPSAKVSVKYPCCPDCGEVRADTFEIPSDGFMRVVGHENVCSCGFNWLDWEDEQFS